MEYTVKQLHDGAINNIPTTGGVYFIKMPTDYVFEVLLESEGRPVTSKGQPSSYPVKELKQKIEDVYGPKPPYSNNILYIGKTNHNVGLRKRLIEYLGFRYSEKTKPHNGGRSIWQLKRNEDFIVEVLPCSKDEDPGDKEHDLLLKYKEQFGNYPFANRRS